MVFCALIAAEVGRKEDDGDVTDTCQPRGGKGGQRTHAV